MHFFDVALLGGHHMARKIMPSQQKGKACRSELTEIGPYVLAFLVLLIGLASVASFIGMLITAFARPALCLPLAGIFALTLRLAYGVIRLILQPNN
jgi:hypothetical protein